MGKCLKDVREATLKVVSWDLLGDPPGGNRGTKGVRIGIANKRKNGLALEKGHTKPTEQYQVLRGLGNLMREMRSWSNYTNW